MWYFFVRIITTLDYTYLRVIGYQEITSLTSTLPSNYELLVFCPLPIAIGFISSVHKNVHNFHLRLLNIYAIELGY